MFYRDPDCVPEDFNLLNFFEIPAVFDCPATMTGASLWVGEALAGAPKIVTMYGADAVAVCFDPPSIVPISEACAVPDLFSEESVLVECQKTFKRRTA